MSKQGLFAGREAVRRSPAQKPRIRSPSGPAKPSLQLAVHDDPTDDDSKAWAGPPPHYLPIGNRDGRTASSRELAEGPARMTEAGYEAATVRHRLALSRRRARKDRTLPAAGSCIAGGERAALIQRD